MKNKMVPPTARLVYLICLLATKQEQRIIIIKLWTMGENNVKDDNGNKLSTNDTLPKPILILFALNGATLSLPILASSSLINDRIAIPPSYLSVYYAISFLPYSLKPLYAHVSTIILKQDYNCTCIFYKHSDYNTIHSNHQTNRHTTIVLLAFLLFLSGLFTICTGFLPSSSNSITPCFLLAFCTGVTLSWAEFLTSLLLIDYARKISRSYNDYNSTIQNDNHQDNTLLSHFQSQAATYRNVGSFMADLVVLFVLLIRHYILYSLKQYTSDQDDLNSDITSSFSSMGDGLVTSFFIMTSILPFLGVYLVLTTRFSFDINERQDEYTNNIEQLTESPLDYDVKSNKDDEVVDPSITELKSRTFKEYNLVSNVEEHDTKVENSLDKNYNTNHSYDHSITLQGRSSESKTNLNILTTFKFEALSLILFQFLLILFALQTPILSIISQSWFNFVIILLIIALVIAVTLPYFTCVKGTNTYENISSSTKLSSIKKVAFYLIARHAIPSTQGILSSFTYTALRSKPLLLQMLSIMGSASSTVSTAYYTNYVSKQYTTVRGIGRVIILTTVIGSFISLLYIPLIRIFSQKLKNGSGDEDYDDDTSEIDVKDDFSKIIITFMVFVQLLSSFVSELSFIPSVILATISLNLYDITDSSQVDETTQSDEAITVGRTSDGTGRNEITSSISKVDDSVLYGVLISCIDFGDQLGDWILVPIVQSLNIQRDNQWENLDILVCVVTILGIISLFLLRVIWNLSS